VTDELVISYFACMQVGVLGMPIAPQVHDGEIGMVVAQADARLVLTEDGRPHAALATLATLPIGLPGEPGDAARAEARARTDALDLADPALIRTTSGTTGSRPKLIVRSNETVPWLYAHRDWHERADGIYCCAMAGTFMVGEPLRVFSLGATLVLPGPTTPELLERVVADEGVTFLQAVPTQLGLLGRLTTPPPAGLRLAGIRTTSAALAPKVKEALEARYGVPVIVEYGLSEGGYALRTRPTGTPPGSIGRPIAGVEIRLVDGAGGDVPDGATGELIFRSPTVMLGYLGDAAATAEVVRDGWLYTGDLARRDADGFYFLEGRRTLQLNVGGLKVAPEEVEAVLERHPGVREAAVVGQPDALRGEVVRAIVVPGMPVPTVAELQRFCRANLAAHKVPRRIEFRDSLPRSPIGKVLRHRL
jgi:acyl-coenzyme A synthetase/AMP-(fatty) acid ligase